MARRAKAGGGSGGGMDGGNSVAVPQPVNYAPGLNAIWVFGENMQCALGLNHQLAFGNNQQLCVNPMAVLDIFGVRPPMTDAANGLLGGGNGGNLQLTVGSSAQVTLGQAFEINLGPKKISIDTDDDDHGVAHLCTRISAGVLSVLAAAYGIAYGVLSGGKSYEACGVLTMTYQIAVDAILEIIMTYETVNRKYEGEVHADHGVCRADPPAEKVEENEAIPSNSTAFVVFSILAELGATALAGDGRCSDEQTSDESHQASGGG